MRRSQLIRYALSIEEAVGLITDSKRFLEPYKAYGKMITDGITQLDRLEGLVRAGSFSDALNMSSSMCDQITAYRGFVPKLAENLEKITEILKRLS